MIFLRYLKNSGFWLILVHPTVVSVLLSASVERCFVSRTRDFFLHAQTYLFGSREPQTDFVFTPNTIFHIFSHLCDHLDQASDLEFVEFVLPLFFLFLLKSNPKSYQIYFKAYLISKIFQKRRRKKIT